MMLHEIAYMTLWGETILFWTGAMAVLSFSFTSALCYLHFEHSPIDRMVSVHWHIILAAASILILLFHGFMELSLFFNF